MGLAYRRRSQSIGGRSLFSKLAPTNGKPLPQKKERTAWRCLLEQFLEAVRGMPRLASSPTVTKVPSGAEPIRPPVVAVDCDAAAEPFGNVARGDAATHRLKEVTRLAAGGTKVHTFCPSGTTKLPRQRLSTSRRTRSLSGGKQSAAPTRLARQQQELRRIARARDHFSVLGLVCKELQRMSLKEREHVILHRYRELSRLVHPDKCPVEIREAATRIFQQLEAARHLALKCAEPGVGHQMQSTSRTPWPSWGFR
mmetsp:Transcript_20578/g.45012  ORF Transcript_20578/g.45012 Transcript_20578/m.45012 type:complete len:254 (-) Transcript_20578:217-978(-)